MFKRKRLKYPKDDIGIVSIMKGKLIELSKVNDEVFSSGMLGTGYAIVPTSGNVVSPVSGKITATFPTGHAYGITTESGLEFLVHLGINTVELGSGYFESIVSVGDFIKQGEQLSVMKIKEIKKEGIDTTAIVIALNNNEVVIENEKEIEINEMIYRYENL